MDDTPDPSTWERRGTPYRTLLTFTTGPDLLDRVLDSLETVLREDRGWKADLSATGFQRDRRGQELLLVRREGPDAYDFRARLTHTQQVGARWCTELTVHVPNEGAGWLLVDVSNQERLFVGVPGLVRRLIDTVDLHDGGSALRMSHTPTVITSDMVDLLADDVCSVDRGGLFFVAGADRGTRLDDAHMQRVTAWTRHTLGQAGTAVLTPDAGREFAEAVGHEHGVMPGTVRTFKPGVDPAVDGDARRHRFLARERLGGTTKDVIARLLGKAARDNAVTRALPDEVVEVLRRLSQLEDDHVLEGFGGPSARAAPTPRKPRAADAGNAGDAASGGEPASPGATARERVKQQLHQRQLDVDELSAENKELEKALDEEQLEHAVTDEMRARLTDEVRWLRELLRAYGAPEVAEARQREWAIGYPESYSDLLARLPGLSKDGVVFTGDEEKCRHLDGVDSLGKSTRTAWEALLVLCDYLKARRRGDWTQGVDEYLRRTPDGYRPMPVSKHARNETKITKRQHGLERRFPVPEEVSATGVTIMTAHFKLGRIGMISPRMYYLDDYTKTGKVYVGYIGTHLENTHTR